MGAIGALSLGVTIGSKIKIGEQLIEVTNVVGAMDTTIKAGGKTFVITDSERKEVMPSVFMSVGWSEQTKDARYPTFSRLLIEAPRALRISRVPKQ